MSDECRKWKFYTRAEARRARRNLYGRRRGHHDGPLSIYRCPTCDFYHLGHLPARVRNGALDKDRYVEGVLRARD